ncbi:hypothetical protein BH20ACT13_BH20ACT13_20130 [soil metagenome]
MLFSPENHEPLTDEPWDEETVRARIRVIVADADASFHDHHLWTPVEDWDTGGGSAPLPLTTLYRGASGVCWALDMLRRRAVAESQIDLAALARRAYEIWRANPAPECLDPPVRTHASLFDGDSGMLLVAYKLAPAPDLADTLHVRVRENWDCEANDLLSGAPGTMLAAKAMLDWTGEERWAEAWREVPRSSGGAATGTASGRIRRTGSRRARRTGSERTRTSSSRAATCSRPTDTSD